jgi:hypothetical protein
MEIVSPGNKDFGIHKAIWDVVEEEDFVFPAEKDRIVVSYQAGGQRVAYIEPLAVGDELPDMPLFLAGDLHVMTPLKATYQAAWAASPEALRVAVQTRVVPDPDAD